MKRRNMVTLGYGDQRVTVPAVREADAWRPARGAAARMAAGEFGPALQVRKAARLVTTPAERKAMLHGASPRPQAYLDAARAADALRMAREETAFAFGRAAVRDQARADRALPRDAGTPEGSARSHLAEIAGAGSERIRRRCSPIDDPAFKLDPALRLAGQRFERLAAEAEGVERMRGTLDDSVATPRFDDNGDMIEPDPDAARARAVRAHRAFEAIAGQVPALPALATPNGNLSEWQVLQAVVIHKQALVRVACGKGRRYTAAKRLLEAALARVERLLPEWAR